MQKKKNMTPTAEKTNAKVVILHQNVFNCLVKHKWPEHPTERKHFRSNI